MDRSACRQSPWRASWPAAFGLLTLALLLPACAGSWTVPGDPEAHYHCRADSALRYRGRADPRMVNVRPAPPHGTCRHQ